MRQQAQDRKGDTEKTLTVVWARVPNGHFSTAIQTTLGPKRPPTWKVWRHAPKKTWVKQVKYSLKNRHLTLVDDKTLTTDPLAWSQVAGRPSAPTAAYELRRRIRHNTS